MGFETQGQTPSPKNTWICEKETVIVDSPFMAMHKKDCRSSEDGRKHQFYFFKSRNWCNIIPVTEDGKIVMIRQFRIGIDQHTLEVPGGVTDPSDQNTQEAAIREMTEETGYVPLPGAKCLDLGWTHPNPAIMDNTCHSFIVGPVKKERNQKLDHGEMIEVFELDLEEFAEMVLKGQVTHALMLNAFFFLMLHSENGKKVLVDQLKQFTKLTPDLSKA